MKSKLCYTISLLECTSSEISLLFSFVLLDVTPHPVGIIATQIDIVSIKKIIIPQQSFSYIKLLQINEFFITLPAKMNVLARFEKPRRLIGQMTSFNPQHRSSQSKVRKVDVTEEFNLVFILTFYSVIRHENFYLDYFCVVRYNKILINWLFL